MRKSVWEDDGRTIADMSGIGRPALWAVRRRSGKTEPKVAPDAGSEALDLTRKERLFYALGALKAALLIGAAFMAGLGLVIGFLCMLWS